jgi:hypothetical protein
LVRIIVPKLSATIGSDSRKIHSSLQDSIKRKKKSTWCHLQSKWMLGVTRKEKEGNRKWLRLACLHGVVLCSSNGFILSNSNICQPMLIAYEWCMNFPVTINCQLTACNRTCHILKSHILNWLFPFLLLASKCLKLKLLLNQVQKDGLIHSNLFI